MYEVFYLQMPRKRQTSDDLRELFDSTQLSDSESDGELDIESNCKHPGLESTARRDFSADEDSDFDEVLTTMCSGGGGERYQPRKRLPVTVYEVANRHRSPSRSPTPEQPFEPLEMPFDQPEAFGRIYENLDDFPRPEVVKRYNRSMGGVDHLDQMLTYYRIYLKSRKWTLRVIMYFMDMAIVASWMEYLADSKRLELKADPLLTFRTELARSFLCYEAPGLTIARPVGRPRNDADKEGEVPDFVPKRARFDEPLRAIRADHYDHMPMFDDAKNNSRCRMPGCKQKTFIYCAKCKAHLCLTRDKNHFADYHRIQG